jgi:hypothetical protein
VKDKVLTGNLLRIVDQRGMFQPQAEVSSHYHHVIYQSIRAFTRVTLRAHDPKTKVRRFLHSPHHPTDSLSRYVPLPPNSLSASLGVAIISSGSTLRITDGSRATRKDDTHLPNRHGLKNSLQCKKGHSLRSRTSG